MSSDRADGEDRFGRSIFKAVLRIGIKSSC